MILDQVLRRFGVNDLTETEKLHLNRAWHWLDPWPDGSASTLHAREFIDLADQLTA